MSLRSRLQSEPIDPLRGASITDRLALGPYHGRNVLTWQTLPGCEEPLDQGLGTVAGLSRVEIDTAISAALRTINLLTE